MNTAAAKPVTPSLQSPHRNKLLATLTSEELAGLAAHLEWVPMRVGELIYEPGTPLHHAYFPTTAIVSLHHMTESGATVETSGVGNEGVVGVPIFMGGETTSGSAIVQASGHAYRLERRVLQQQFNLGGTFQRVLLRYTQALMMQISQTAACYRYHSIEQQLSGWLLSTFDRTLSQDLILTQELVAGLLGVRRESITETAGKLQAMGFIRYRRGHISVLDPLGLETRACECYMVIKIETDRLLAGAPYANSTAKAERLQ